MLSRYKLFLVVRLFKSARLPAVLFGERSGHIPESHDVEGKPDLPTGSADLEQRAISDLAPRLQRGRPTGQERGWRDQGTPVSARFWLGVHQGQTTSHHHQGQVYWWHVELRRVPGDRHQGAAYKWNYEQFQGLGLHELHIQTIRGLDSARAGLESLILLDYNCEGILMRGVLWILLLSRFDISEIIQEQC